LELPLPCLLLLSPADAQPRSQMSNLNQRIRLRPGTAPVLRVAPWRGTRGGHENQHRPRRRTPTQKPSQASAERERQAAHAPHCIQHQQSGNDRQPMPCAHMHAMERDFIRIERGNLWVCVCESASPITSLGAWACPFACWWRWRQRRAIRSRKFPPNPEIGVVCRLETNEAQMMSELRWTEKLVEDAPLRTERTTCRCPGNHDHTNDTDNPRFVR
jgi:hypothetical protein